MFICVWRRMRQMNDDLIVTIAVNCSTFLSIWMTFTDFTQDETRNEKLCSGDFFSASRTMDWQKITRPKTTDLPR